MKKLGTYLILVGAVIMLVIMLFADPYGQYIAPDKSLIVRMFNRFTFLLDFWYVMILIIAATMDLIIKWKDSQFFVLVNSLMVTIAMLVFIRPLLYFAENYNFLEQLGIWWTYEVATWIILAGGIAGIVRIGRRQM